MRIAVLLLLLTGCVLSISCSSSGLNFMIFRTEESIMRMNYNGTGRQVLFTGDDTNFNPTLSRNGSKIAFASYSSTDGDFRILLMNANGSNVRELANQPLASHHPAYHPNNRTLAFQSEASGSYQIYRINDDGSGLQQLTFVGANRHPAWNPDGTKLAFMSTRDGNQEIYVMDADGSNQGRLTNNSDRDFRPSWSRDGTRLLFTSDRVGSTQQVWIMNANGSNPQQLTSASQRSWGGAFSPDGRKIVFSREGLSLLGQVWIMDADGSNQVNLSNNANDEYDVSTGTG
jgi:Tol biopolymer transport system component